MLKRKSSPKQRSQQLRLLQFHGLVIFSCSRNRRSEDIGVETIIVLELELCNVQMQILFAYVVECADASSRSLLPQGGAFDAIGPATSNQIGFASLIVANGEHGVELARCHLVDWFGVARGHGVSSFVGGYRYAG